MSLNLLTANETDPVIWRGPVIAGVVTQFWQDVVWGDVDYMFVDMPPGTGDVPLTVFQSLPVDGVIVVTSPQDLVSMIVTKAVNMAQMMNIPRAGPGGELQLLPVPRLRQPPLHLRRESPGQVAAELGLPVLAKLPIDPRLAAAFDAGKIESLEHNYLADVASRWTCNKIPCVTPVLGFTHGFFVSSRPCFSFFSPQSIMESENKEGVWI